MIFRGKSVKTGGKPCQYFLEHQMVEGWGVQFKKYTPWKFLLQQFVSPGSRSVEMTRCIFVFSQTIFYTLPSPNVNARGKILKKM